MASKAQQPQRCLFIPCGAPVIAGTRFCYAHRLPQNTSVTQGQQPEDDELNKILLQYHAEQNQGLNELAGHGTADEQLKENLTLWADRRADKRVEEARIDEVIRIPDTLKEPGDYECNDLNHVFGQCSNCYRQMRIATIRATHHPKGGSNE